MLIVGVKFAVMPGIACSMFIPLVLAQQFGMDAQGIAGISMMGSVIGIPILLGAGWLSDKLKTRKWVGLGAVLLTLGLTFGLFVQNQMAFCVIAVAIFSVGSGPVNAVLNAAFPEVHPYKNVASAFGLSAAVGGLFTYAFAQALGILADQTGAFQAGWILLAVLLGLASILIWRVKIR